MLISKLDAAKRQLETAIKMFLLDADPVATHTLTAAAHQVLTDIGKARSVSSIFKEEALYLIRDEHKAKYLHLLSRAENFFKHADKDPEGQIEFNPEVTGSYLMDAIVIYKKLTSEQVPLMIAFLTWFSLKNPTLFKNPKDFQTLRNLRPDLNPENKSSFLALEKDFSEAIYASSRA